ncbi:MAG: hypothetical protein F6K03_02340 [Kamptonema sp. SIO4C4]|nr:hypothetical protein [Kamptonema sp. SIO4C4]
MFSKPSSLFSLTLMMGLGAVAASPEAFALPEQGLQDQLEGSNSTPPLNTNL